MIASDSGVDLGVFKPLVLAEGHVVGKVIIGIGQLEVARCFLVAVARGQRRCAEQHCRAKRGGYDLFHFVFFLFD